MIVPAQTQTYGCRTAAYPSIGDYSADTQVFIWITTGSEAKKHGILVGK